MFGGLPSERFGFEPVAGSTVAPQHGASVPRSELGVTGRSAVVQDDRPHGYELYWSLPQNAGTVGQFGTFELGAGGLGLTLMTKTGPALAALGLGFVLTSCASGPSATVSGPSAKDVAACGPIVKVKLPHEKQGMDLAIAIPTKQAENLIKSGNPTLAETGRIFTQPQTVRPRSANIYVTAFISAQAECQKLGVR